jgi:hypothetical protein
VETELLAQAVEMMSIVASERKLKNPREIPRPDYLRSRTSTTTDGAVNARGHLAVAAAFTTHRKAG